MSKTDWTEAALDALAHDGLAGVAVEPLARRLGTTKGSFYWHFADRAELIAATLELWEQRDTSDVIDRLQAIADPRERLIALASGAYAAAARGNGHVAVLTAASDPAVHAVLQRFTRTWLAFLEALYCELGSPKGESSLRAHLAYAMYRGIGELRHADPESAYTGPQLDAYLKLAVDSIMAPQQPQLDRQIDLHDPATVTPEDDRGDQ
jgi:AcrR family transcriptional regulator